MICPLPAGVGSGRGHRASSPIRVRRWARTPDGVASRVLRRPGGAQPDVLFQDDPATVAGVVQRGEQAPEVHLPVPQGGEDALPDRRGVVCARRPRAAQHAPPHVLGVDVPDPAGVAPADRHRVGAAVDQVPGVQAEPGGVRRRRAEQGVDLRRRLDVRAGVGVEGDAHAERGAVPGERGQQRPDARPGAGREAVRRRRPPGDRPPVRVAGVGGHQRRALQLAEQPGQGQRLPQRLPAAAGSRRGSGQKAPTRASSRRASSRRRTSGRAGRNPAGPSSVPPNPAALISSRTAPQGGTSPQPGSSQTPQVIGAAASRGRRPRPARPARRPGPPAPSGHCTRAVRRGRRGRPRHAAGGAGSRRSPKRASKRGTSRATTSSSATGRPIRRAMEVTP